MKKVAVALLGATATTAMLLGAPTSAVGAVTYLGDNHLEVVASSDVQNCGLGNSPGDPLPEQCGPTLLVRTDALYLFYDSDAPFVDASCSLTSDTGEQISLTDIGVTGCEAYPSGPNGEDASYMGPSVVAETPTDTGLPAGAYTFTYQLSRAGYWSCSIYNPEGCSWNEPLSAKGTYKFTWGGQTLSDIARYVKPLAKCTFRPQLPAKISVGAPVVNVPVPLTIIGTGCKDDYIVSLDLSGRTGLYLLYWSTSAPHDDLTIRAAWLTGDTGRHHPTDPSCSAYALTTLQKHDCTVVQKATTIKFASRAKLSATRSGSNIRFTVATSSYSAHGYVKSADTVRIQRYVNHKWRTVHTAKTNARTGSFTWTHKYPKKARYRVVSSATGTAWASTSKTVSR